MPRPLAADSTLMPSSSLHTKLRLVESLALLATIPAFYLALKSRQRTLGTLLYLAVAPGLYATAH